MRPSLLRVPVTGCVLATLLAASPAEAQWVYVARKALGRIEQVSQAPDTNGPSYDAAAVMLEAPSDKVWEAVLRGLHGNTQGLVITLENPADHLVQFKKGKQVAGIKVSSLGDNLTHLLVSSAQTGGQPSASATVLNSVLRVCRDMNVECAPMQN